MSGDASKAWDDVISSVKELGQVLKRRVDEGGAEGREEADAVGGVLEDMAAKARDLGSRAADTVKDPELKVRTKAVGDRLLGALSATLAEVSSDLDQVVKRHRGDEQAPGAGDVPGSAPPAPPPPV